MPQSFNSRKATQTPLEMAKWSSHQCGPANALWHSRVARCYAVQHSLHGHTTWWTVCLYRYWTFELTISDIGCGLGEVKILHSGKKSSTYCLEEQTVSILYTVKNINAMTLNTWIPNISMDINFVGENKLFQSKFSAGSQNSLCSHENSNMSHAGCSI